MPDELISQAELDGIRADAEQLFVDTIQIERILGPGALNANGTTDPQPRSIILAPVMADGEWVPNASIYPIMSRRDRFDEFGQGLIFTRQYRVDLRWSVDTVQIRDRVIVIASQDPQFLEPMADGSAREFEVRDVVLGTNLGYRRLTIHDFRE